MCCPINTAVNCPLLGLDLQWSGWSTSSYSRHQDSLQYKHILKNVMMPAVRLLYANSPNLTTLRFMIHIYSLRTSMLPAGVRLIDWPLWAPDVNPIKNMWMEVNKTMQDIGPSCQLQWWSVGPCQMPGMKLLHLSVMFDPYLSCLYVVTFKGNPFNLLKPSGKFTYHQVVFPLHLCVSYGSPNKQQLLTYAALMDCFFYKRGRVFHSILLPTHALNDYKHSQFTFKTTHVKNVCDA
jgi:hypothetical protein